MHGLSACSGGICAAASFRTRARYTRPWSAPSSSTGIHAPRTRPLRLPAFARRPRRLDWRIGAAWLFGGDDKGEAMSERSESTDQDILALLFQLDMGARVQYCLNLEQYDIAQQLRNSLAEVETEIVKQQKYGRGSLVRNEAQDMAIKLLRLRADLQKAIDLEDYAAAADLRDKISRLEAESLAISAKALAYETIEYSFRLGQRVKHKIFGYQAVVCGMDPFCCESSAWMEVAHVDKLSRGPNQPFYQVLVDVHADLDIVVAYVSEENLLVRSEHDDMGMFDHPYLSFLFYGTDTAGDFIPIKQLREKYSRPRYEVPMQNEDHE